MGGLFFSYNIRSQCRRQNDRATAPIANLKNASFEGREKKEENQEKIRKNKKLKVRNNFVA
jgi:hypothetical protein